MQMFVAEACTNKVFRGISGRTVKVDWLRVYINVALPH